MNICGREFDSRRLHQILKGDDMTKEDFYELSKRINKEEFPQIELIELGARMTYPDRGIAYDKYITMTFQKTKIVLCNDGTWSWTDI